MHATSILQAIFNCDATSVRSSSAGQRFEVNGLSKGSAPANCTVLRTGHERHSRAERREHYLVDVQGATLFFRVCQAMEGSGYAEYACGQLALEEQQRTELRRYATDWIAQMCTAQPVR